MSISEALNQLRTLVEAYDQPRALTPEEETAVAKATKKLEKIVKKYEKYNDNTPDTPPPHATMWFSRDGTLKLAQNHWVYSKHSVNHLMRVGVLIGSRFGNKEVKAKLEAEVKAVLKDIQSAVGGYIEDGYGSNYSPLGWIAKS